MSLSYAFEVLAPGDGEVLVHETSAVPFAGVAPGDLVRAGARVLQVTRREHRIDGAGEARVHVVSLHTEEVAAARSLSGTLTTLGQATREHARRLSGEVSDAGMRAGQLVEEYRPVIGELLEKRVGPLVGETLHNDSLIEGALRSVYQVLPLPLRVALQEDRFVQLCLRQRERLAPSRAPDTEP